MPSVNWDPFVQLPGSAQQNFEMLCRALIRRHYGRYGQFAALANQPGVEFHLKLHTPCVLGEPGRWFGWQCRWYDLPTGRALGTTRRKKIEHALATTERVLPGLTDWVLWTRRALTKGDQKWFYGLKSRMDLDLWTASDVEDLLSGEAEIFRATYFGELVLTPNSLATLHDTWVARVKRRWLPEAHQPIDTERTLRRMLGEGKSWDHLLEVAARIKAAVVSIRADMRNLPGTLNDTATKFVEAACGFAAVLTDTRTLLDRGDLDLLRQQLNARPRELSQDLTTLPRRLRAARNRAVFMTTNAVADLRLGRRLLDEVDSFLGTRLVAVLADAGGGKTQLAAQITAPVNGRPAGILLFGQDLHAGQDLDQLARKIIVPGTGVPVSSMEALVAAVDAAGQRAHRRLPIIIDGLNEAEDPRNWKAPLASLNETLRSYPHVLVICTLRTGARRPSEQNILQRGTESSTDRMAFADDALPDGVQRLEIPDFADDTMEAIERYFRYYRINPGDADLPIELLSHPLTLRLFCEVTNPFHEQEVGIEKMPGSLSTLFDRYLEQAAARIAELAPRSHRYYAQDVHIAYNNIGTALWMQRARDLDVDNLRTILGDDLRPWDKSIIRALEQEGVILRIPGNSPGTLRVMAVYDAMAGHLIADAILSKHVGDGLGAWLKEPATSIALNGAHVGLHPLASDIFRSLVGLVPQRLRRQQLWKLLDDPLRTIALRYAANLEAAYLDAETITALSALITRPPAGAPDLLFRLYHTRGAMMHPLNADFLDSLLRPMGIAERDLLWTEWIRRNRDGLLDDLRRLEKQWCAKPTIRKPSDMLRAQWVMWMLASTIRELRDQATRALYWFGRGNPSAIFEMTYKALAINDPYVGERMLAASYGVAMARHVDIAARTFVTITLPECARRVYELMFKNNAPHSTTHVLAREYGQRLLELAIIHHPKLFSAIEKIRIKPPYKDGGLRVWQESDTIKDAGHGCLGSPFNMDFENYTLGSLVDSRSNYDFQHPEYRKIRAQILWRVEQLGWNLERFGKIDRCIANNDHSGRIAKEGNKTERYGKKYSWIAYYEMAGLLQDQGKLERNEDGRIWDIDIDPSFPAPLPKGRPISKDFLGDSKSDLHQWVASGEVPNVAPCLRMSKIMDEKGPWVALDGFFAQEDNRRNRRIFCFIRSFLVARNEADSFFKHLLHQDLGGRWLPEKPSVIYAFAGEIPWCETYPKNGSERFQFVAEEHTVKIRRKLPALFLDGNRLPLTQATLVAHRILGDVAPLRAGQTTLSPEEINRIEVKWVIVDEEEVRRKMKHFETVIPVRDFGWEGRSLENESVHGTTLAKEIARDLRLVGQPQTLDLFTKDGVRVTIGLAEREDYNNSQQLFFIREEVLKRFLKKRKQALVWAIWGERGYSTNLIKIMIKKDNWPDPKYQVFQAIKRFKV